MIKGIVMDNYFVKMLGLQSHLGIVFQKIWGEIFNFFNKLLFVSFFIEVVWFHKDCVYLAISEL